jgi:hypothetical protein
MSLVAFPTSTVCIRDTGGVAISGAVLKSIVALAFTPPPELCSVIEGPKPPGPGFSTSRFFPLVENLSAFSSHGIAVLPRFSSV